MELEDAATDIGDREDFVGEERIQISLQNYNRSKVLCVVGLGYT